jgi:hypothetical protein
MDQFLSARGEKVTGTISVFDRLIIKGHLPLGYPGGMEKLLSREHRLLKNLKPFVLAQSERIREHARRLAVESGRPYEYYNTKIQKDQRAREIADRDHVDEGLICVIATVEPCRSFRIAYGEGKPRIVPARRKCLLSELYPRLLRHATLAMSAEDVMTFLGRKLHGSFAGESRRTGLSPHRGTLVLGRRRG